MDINDYSEKIEFWKRLEKLLSLVKIEGYYENEEVKMIVKVCDYKIAKQDNLATSPILARTSGISVRLISTIKSMERFKENFDTVTLEDLSKIPTNQFFKERNFGKRSWVELRDLFEEASLPYK